MPDSPGLFTWVTAAATGDDFNRADGGLGANWTTDTFFNNPLTIVSNTCRPTVGGGHNVAVYNASGIVQANQYAQVKIAITGASAVGTVLRSDGAGTFYICFYTPCTIYKCVAGSFTQLISGSTQPDTVNDVIYFEAVGNVLTLKVNGIVINTVPDSSIPGAGYTGIDVFDNTGAVDDFQMGTL